MKIWIITRCDNAYDQYGDYFTSAFDHEPTLPEIQSFLGCDEEYAKHLLKGGGRIRNENSWYFLTKMSSGELYNPH